MGNERRDLHAGPLSRQRGRQRQDVVDDDLWVTFGHERLRFLGRLQDCLVGLQWRLTGREDGVFRRRRKGQSFAAYKLLPLPRGLQRHLVAARAQRAAERDHREGMARVAEGAEQDPHWASVCRQLGD